MTPPVPPSQYHKPFVHTSQIPKCYFERSFFFLLVFGDSGMLSMVLLVRLVSCSLVYFHLLRHYDLFPLSFLILSFSKISSPLHVVSPQKEFFSSGIPPPPLTIPPLPIAHLMTFFSFLPTFVPKHVCQPFHPFLAFYGAR